MTEPHYGSTLEHLVGIEEHLAARGHPDADLVRRIRELASTDAELFACTAEGWLSRVLSSLESSKAHEDDASGADLWMRLQRVADDEGLTHWETDRLTRALLRWLNRSYFGQHQARNTFAFIAAFAGLWLLPGVVLAAAIFGLIQLF